MSVTVDPLARDGAHGNGAATDRRSGGLRIGVDVGGTFTKAVAIETAPFALRAQEVVPTSHTHSDGVMSGVADALRALIERIGDDRGRIQLVAFSTTQAMNALLEGDVPLVGVVGLGARPDQRKARKRTRVGSIELAPGRSLETVHRFLDVTGGVDGPELGRVMDELEAAGCAAVAVSGAFAVEAPELELAVRDAAAERGLPACCGHELTQAYGLETRTVSAAINAAILPVVERTAGLVEAALAEAGLDVPLLVLRGDGGAMGADAFRSRPSFTVGSGPAAGVAAALHQVGAGDAVVVECGGTSTNVSVVRSGRPVLRSIKVMGRPTAIRSIDSWVVGMAGGSMVRLGRRGVAGVGPRSAHVAGLPYACFADPADLEGARVALIAPRPGDAADYVALDAAGGRYALTASCAANALGRVDETAHAHGHRASALAGFAAVAGHIGRGDAEDLAGAALDAGLEQISGAVGEAVRSHSLEAGVPLIALGGAGAALVPELGARLGREVIEPAHPDVLASVGAATTLIRAEVVSSTRTVEPERRMAVVNAAERACVDAGAAPGTVSVETRFETDEGLLRAVATGAVALEAGAAGREPASAGAQLEAASTALAANGVPPRELVRTEFYAAYGLGSDGDQRIAVVDRLGCVPVVESPRSIVVDRGERFCELVATAIEDASLNLGIASLIPRVTVVCGPRLLDLSDSRRPEELLASVRGAVADHPGDALAIVAR